MSETIPSRGADVSAGVHCAGSPSSRSCDADGVKKGEDRDIVIRQSMDGSTAGSRFFLNPEPINEPHRAVLVPDWLYEAVPMGLPRKWGSP